MTEVPLAEARLERLLKEVVPVRQTPPVAIPTCSNAGGERGFDPSEPVPTSRLREGPFHGHQCGVHVRNISHRCGLRGCHVGAASNPGPVQTRNARRLQSTQLDCESGSSFEQRRDEEVFHVCRAQSSVNHGGPVVVRSNQTVLSPPKRLRLTCGDLPRLSQATTVPPPQSLRCAGV